MTTGTRKHRNTGTRKPAGPEGYRLERREEIARRADVDALKGRGLNVAAARRHMDAVQVAGPHGRRFGYAMPNEASGLAVTLREGERVTIGARGFSRVLGNPTGAAHVFATAFDFLAYLTLYGLTEPTGETFILHRPDTIEAVLPELRKGEGFPRVIIWLGNTEAGRALTDRVLGICTEDGREGAAMNYLYEDFPSLFEWHTATRPPQRMGDPVKWYYDSAYHLLVQSRQNGPEVS